MRRHTVGRTSVEVTELGLGGAALGNLYAAVSDNDAASTIAAAYEAGVRYFDTAPSYGNGLSETRMGAALSDYDRADIVLSTKVGYSLDGDGEARPVRSMFKDTYFLPRTDFTADAIKRSLEESLSRLRTDRIDLVWIHDPDEANSIREGADPYAVSHFDRAMAEAYPILDDLRTQRMIGAIGVGMNQWQMLEDFAGAGQFDCFLLAGRYTLLEQGALDSFLPLCVEQGISVVIGGPYGSGVLASGATEGARYNYSRAAGPVLARVREMEAVCAHHDVALPSAALQFALAHPAVVSVIPGARNAAEAQANADHHRRSIPSAFWDELKDLELIDVRAPVPTEGEFQLER